MWTECILLYKQIIKKDQQQFFKTIDDFFGIEECFFRRRKSIKLKSKFSIEHNYFRWNRKDTHSDKIEWIITVDKIADEIIWKWIEHSINTWKQMQQSHLACWAVHFVRINVNRIQLLSTEEQMTDTCTLWSETISMCKNTFVSLCDISLFTWMRHTLATSEHESSIWI